MADRWGNNAEVTIIIRSFKEAEKLMPRNMYDSYRREMREVLRERQRVETNKGRKGKR